MPNPESLHDLGNRGPEGRGNQRERDAENDNRAVGDQRARIGREYEGEDQVADRHQDCTEDQHRSALALMVEVAAEQRRNGRGAHREPPEDVGGRLGRDPSRLLSRMFVAISLEREDR